jgi:hypothetical protein
VQRPFRSLALCALAAVLVSGCTGKNAVSDGSGGPQLGGRPQSGANELLRVEDRLPAPTIHGETLDGHPLDLASLQGKVATPGEAGNGNRTSRCGVRRGGLQGRP